MAAAGYAALPVVLTWPLASQITEVLPYDLGDPLLSTTTLWWNAHVMPLTARWWDGFAFFPSSGTIALSDHRLGESLLATPLQWAGASAVTVYNLTLLATFPLCALAAYWLGLVLTERHDAAFLVRARLRLQPVPHGAHRAPRAARRVRDACGARGVAPLRTDAAAALAGRVRARRSRCKRCAPPTTRCSS